MNILILGNDPEELAWAKWFRERGEHRLVAMFPGSHDPALAGVPVARDLDDALARPGIDAVIVGGPIADRAESLRRAAAEGLAIICIHPPGLTPRRITRSPSAALKPARSLCRTCRCGCIRGWPSCVRPLSPASSGAFRGLRIEAQSGTQKLDLPRMMFTRIVDVVRALLGEIEALTATGDPPGQHPDLELIVQLRTAGTRRAELRLCAGPDEACRISLLGASGSMTLEVDPRFEEPARLIRRVTPHPDEVHELQPWDAHEAIFSVLSESSSRRDSTDLPHPSLLDATRTMELSEATARSLRRGRTVDLHYEEVSEEATFKAVMTSTGCVVLLIALFILPIALGGPALGLDWTIYIAYVIPPALVIFVAMQALRLAVRRPETPNVAASHKSQGNETEPGS